MGYYTDYEIEVLNGDPDEVVRAAIKELSGYGGWQGDELHDVKWYSSQKDCLTVSKQFPDKLIQCTGVGEETGDVWVEYYLNGKSQYEKAKITFPDFDKNKLK